jgi:hypothetical protein
MHGARVVLVEGALPHIAQPDSTKQPGKSGKIAPAMPRWWPVEGSCRGVDHTVFTFAELLRKSDTRCFSACCSKWIRTPSLPIYRISPTPIVCLQNITERAAQQRRHTSDFVFHGRQPMSSVATVAAVTLAVVVFTAAPCSAASGVTVDEEGVIHQRGDSLPEPFDLDKLQAVHSGTHDQLDAPGVGTSYRVHYDYNG